MKRPTMALATALSAVPTAALLVWAGALGCSGGGGGGTGDDAGPVRARDGDPGTQPPIHDVVSIFVRNEAPAPASDVPVTFAQVFRAGDVPSDFTLSARYPDGTPIALQVDPKATHADGSLRHAVLTVVLPHVGAAERQEILLATARPETTPPPLSLTDLMASGFDATVSLNVAGTVYTAAAMDLLQHGAPETWLAGNEVTEWIVGAPVVDAAGRPHPHLAAYFHVRHYRGGETRVDVVVENGWTQVPGPGDITYDATITMNGATVFSQAALTHYHHARWHHLSWSPPATEGPRLYVSFDGRYLRDSKAIPNYQVGLSPSDASLDQWSDAVAPMGTADLPSYFADGGSAPQIAPLPQWAAQYIVTMDPRAYQATLANADAAGSYSIHYRDKDTGRPVSIVDYPTLSENSGSLLPEASGSSPLDHDEAHQPSLAFVPYLVTGDYFYLEELQFWANYNLLQTSAASREGEKGIWKEYDNQLRAIAWSMRTLGQAAYLTPDDDPLQHYFAQRIGFNLAYLNERYAADAHANALGAVDDWDRINDGLTNYPPWMMNFFVWSMGYLVELGFDDARPIRDYAAGFVTGMMGTDGGFCYQLASGNRYDIGPTGSEYYASFHEWYQAALPDSIWQQPCGSPELASALTAWTAGGDLEYDYVPGQMLASWSPTSYRAQLQPALAIAVDAGVAHLDGEWARLVESPEQPISHRGGFDDHPEWAIVPRRSTR